MKESPLPDHNPDPHTALAPIGDEMSTDATTADDNRRTEPTALPPHPAGNPQAPLTTDSEAQQDDAVIEPDNS